MIFARPKFLRLTRALTRLTLAAAVLVIVAGCGPAAMDDEGPTGVVTEPTEAGVAVPATPRVMPTDAPTTAASPTPTPPPTPTPTMAPTVTPAPTATAVPTATPTNMPTVEPTATPVPTPTPIPDGWVQAVIGDRTFILELAITSAERSRGLSNREHLAPDGGMLFVFSQESTLSFWMKETLLPLDILFLDSERRIVNIHTMHPQPGVPTGQLTLYRSTSPAQYAVEVNAGIAAELELAPGMVAEFDLPAQ